MFQFSGFALSTYVFSRKYRGITLGGFSHSEIPGSKSASDSPRLIAGNHVLHRLPVPRHPPYALCNFTKNLHNTSIRCKVLFIPYYLKCITTVFDKYETSLKLKA